MNDATTDIRNKTRRVKGHILNRFLKLADQVDAGEPPDDPALYKELMITFARNVVPRTQEITGEDGESIKMEIVKYADNTSALPVHSENISVASPESF